MKTAFCICSKYISDVKGRSPYDCAIHMGDKETVQELLKRGAKKVQRHLAVRL